MKKISFLVLVLVFALCLPLLAACGSGSNGGEETTEKELVASEGLEYYPLPDGTYAVASGTAQYLEEIIIPKEYMDKEVTVIVENAFINCANLKRITIPDSVTSIGNSAFSGCRSLASVVFGENSQLTSIGNCAFIGCGGLTSITIPDSVTSIGSGAFYGCYTLIEIYNLSSLNITAGSSNNGSVGYYAKNVYTDESVASKFVEKDGYIFYCDDDASEYYLMRYTGSDTELVLPDDINGHNYEIYQYAFYYRDDITSITIPAGVTSIGDSAFYSCSSLTSIACGKNSKLISIGDYAFSGCGGLTSIVFGENSKLISIGDGAFGYCYSLTSITIPDNVTSIGSDAFYGCYTLIEIYNLSSLNITAGSSNNGSVGYYAKNVYTDESVASKFVEKDGYIFYCDDDASKYYLMRYTGSDTELILPDDINGHNYKIYNYAFCDRDDITSVAILSGVTIISMRAFDNCSNLTSITIPDSVMGIGHYAFNDCSSLTTVYYMGSEEEWAEIGVGSGNSCLTDATIVYNYVPEE